ncbi:MAG: hypothetical protein ACOYMV_02195 [Verrucomicrobiia bacterium]
MRKLTLLRQAQEQASERTKYALANDARVELTRDGKSFYVLWLPEGADPANPPPMGSRGCGRRRGGSASTAARWTRRSRTEMPTTADFTATPRT